MNWWENDGIDLIGWYGTLKSQESSNMGTCIHRGLIAVGPLSALILDP